VTRVRLVDVPDMIRWVSAHGAETIIGELTDAIERDFGRWQEFDKTSRVASHSTAGVIELMPTSDGRTYGYKYVNGHPSNPARGFQTVTAFGMLADVHNGYPTLLAEMTVLTALRTAATSAMAARQLARPDSSVMAMIGTGAQAEFQALGFRAALGINRLRVWDTDPAALDKFERNAGRLGFDVHRASDAADAVRGADVITTCTADKTNAIVLTDEMVGPGVHVNAIGGDCPGKTELDPRILPRSRVFVEYTPQTRVEGEIQHQPAGTAGPVRRHGLRLGRLRDRGLLGAAAPRGVRDRHRLLLARRSRRRAHRPQGPVRLRHVERDHACLAACSRPRSTRRHDRRRRRRS
jgi:ornithine cyclodeaminase